MNKELLPWETDLLQATVRCVSQISTGFASKFWGVSGDIANQRLRSLEKRRLLHGRRVLVSELPRIESPLCVCKPGQEELPHGQVSYRAKRRWRSLPLEIKRVYFATSLARALFGRSPIRPPKDIQATHDLGLSSVYLEYRKRYPKLTRHSWLNESEYAHHRGRCVKVEDAMICHNGRVLLLIDFAGAYRPDRVKALVAHANLHQVPIAIY